MIGVHRLANRLLTWALGPQIGIYNGVAARDRDVLSRDHEPAYKRTLAATVRNRVDDGDDVVVVGGGRSVVAVHAARAGADVTVYEAGLTAYRVTQSVQRLNDVEFEARYAVVGEPGDVDGDIARAVVDPSSLTGDVLVLDCEGAERDILPVDGFDTVIVETHPRRGSTLETIRRLVPELVVVGPDPVDGEVIVA